MNPAALSAFLGNDLENFLAASTPGGIEAQEAAGQKKFVAAQTLPKEIRHATREQLESAGFKFGADADDIFVSCELPEGWTKRASDHSMWSYLHDDKGRERAAIFYKAAFYDRSASASFGTRYYTLSDYKDETRSTIVKDAATGETLFCPGYLARNDYEGGDKLDKAASDWLAERFPDHRNAFAYWD